MTRRRGPRQHLSSRRQRGNGKAPAYAAIDLGTNNCRLLVARPDGVSFKVIDSFSRIVRLGEGLTVSGQLSDEAIDRSIEALKICAQKMRRHKTHHVRSVATEACRQADNSDHFFDTVKQETGIELETIPPEEEAKLTLAGCRPLLDREARYALVFDIGGGSTEVMWIENNEGEAPKLIGVHSINLGVVSLAEKFSHDCISAEDYQWIIGRFSQDLKTFDAEHEIGKHVLENHVQMLGTSGTVTTLAGIYLDLPRYDRSQVDGLVVDFESITSIIARLAAMDFETRCAHPCIRRERADLMVMGCAILDAICRYWPIGKLRVADRGIREGILMAMMSADQNPPPPALSP